MSGGSERGNKVLRALDVWAGIPLCALFGAVRGRRSSGPPARVLHIGLLRSAAIGDTVLLSAAVADLRASFPESRITLFTGGSNFGVAQLIPGIDRVVRLPIANPRMAVREIRSCGAFDVWIDFGQWPRFDALMSHLAESRFKAGFRTRGQHRHYVYDVCCEHRTDRHEVENFRALAALAGSRGDNPPRILAPEQGPEAPCGSVVFHMFPGGSRAAVKSWPSEQWLELGRLVVASGRSVVVTGSERDRDASVAFAANLPAGSALVTAGELGIAETARMLTSASAVVSVDTGVMHMASALGCNLVALHGPTSAKRWGPLNPNSIAIQSSYPVPPWIHLGFEGPRFGDACMRCIGVQEVFQGLMSLLAPFRSTIVAPGA